MAAGVLHAGMRRLLACLAVSLLVLHVLLGADVALAAGAPCEQAVSAVSPHCAHGETVALVGSTCGDCTVCHTVAALPLQVASVARAEVPPPMAQADGAFASAPVAPALKPPIARWAA